jgi:hypothetical protein
MTCNHTRCPTALQIYGKKLRLSGNGFRNSAPHPQDVDNGRMIITRGGTKSTVFKRTPSLTVSEEICLCTYARLFITGPAINKRLKKSLTRLAVKRHYPYHNVVWMFYVLPSFIDAGIFCRHPPRRQNILTPSSVTDQRYCTDGQVFRDCLPQDEAVYLKH